MKKEPKKLNEKGIINLLNITENINNPRIKNNNERLKKLRSKKMGKENSKNKKIVNKKIDTKIGLEFDKYLDINITIPKNISINETIMINYGFSKDDALISKITFNYEENSCCNFVINYDSLIGWCKNRKYF